LTDVDETCSRFRDDSDLSRVNARPGEWVEVDRLLVAAVDVAVDAARRTDGLVNPLLGRQLEVLGYDRDFGLLRLLEDEVAVQPPAPEVGAWRRIALDPAGAVRIPAGTCLDLGATGKAWCSDLIAAAWEEQLSGGALIGLGGDLRVAAPDGRPWLVGVAERPGEPDEHVELVSGGLATSTTRVRRWARRGVRRHHLLDPRTGLPADEVWRTVTALGATCTAANTASTTAVVLGDAAPQQLADWSVSARLVHHDGTELRLGSWPERRNVA
ncbi:MAG TPA: FAD:protein FMN transferase, partial [Nocardioides sp.]